MAAECRRCPHPILHDLAAADCRIWAATENFIQRRSARVQVKAEKE